MTEQPKIMDWAAQSGSGPELYQSFLVPAMFQPFTEHLLDAVRVAGGARVLDVACGTGVVSREAARRAGSSGSVTGVDMAPPMLEIARAEPVDDDAATIKYVQGVADSLPVGDDGFDVATCHHGLQFFPDRPAALAELRRALVPGGRVAIGVWGQTEQQPHFAAMARALTSHIGEAGAAMGAPFALGDPAVLRGLLDDAGFTDVRVDVVTLPVTFAAFSDFARLALGAGPLAPLFTGAPDDVQEAIVADVIADLADFEGPGDTLVSTMTSVVGVAVA